VVVEDVVVDSEDAVVDCEGVVMDELIAEIDMGAPTEEIVIRAAPVRDLLTPFNAARR
jgi:hypothetical protein